MESLAPPWCVIFVVVSWCNNYELTSRAHLYDLVSEVTRVFLEVYISPARPRLSLCQGESPSHVDQGWCVEDCDEWTKSADTNMNVYLV